MTGAYKGKIIYCDTLDAGTLDFGLSFEKKEALAASGEYDVMRFFSLQRPVFSKQHYAQETLTLLEQSNYPLPITEFLAYFRKNRQNDCMNPNVADLIHLHWAILPTLTMQGGCGNRRATVTPLFDHNRKQASDPTIPLIEHHHDNALNKTKDKSIWCMLS